MAQCPICDGVVDENNPPAQGNYQGRKEYFCSIEHKETFEEEHIQESG